MPFRFEMHAATHPGKVRPRNEDAWWFDPRARLAVVADGMGGHPAGADASALAVRAFAASFGAEAPPTSPEERGEAMARSVEAAHEGIRDAVLLQPDQEGMGTTLTAAHFHPDGELVVAHVGDSRAYLWSDGRLRAVTRDHTWVQEAVELGRIPETAAADHPFSHVLTQAVGIDHPPFPDVERRSLRAGDVVLLCSDGLTGPVSDDRIREILGDAAAGEPLTATAQGLIDAALDGGGPDNVTVVLVRVRNGADAGDVPDGEARSGGAALNPDG